ncbi:MAG: type III secretion system export apparatus subunit SctU [Rhabdochlamydiaceae bacterium]
MAEKTEKATPKKLRDARKKGQVAKSQDFPAAFTFIISLTSTIFLSRYLYEQLSNYMLFLFRHVPNAFGLEHKITTFVFQSIFIICSCSLPILMFTALIGVMTNMIIVGPLFATEAMKPDIKRLNPVTNIKNLFKFKTLFELLKSILKISGACFLIYSVVWHSLNDIIATVNMPVIGTTLVFSNFLIKVILRVGIFFLFIAVADLIFQKRQFANEMKMEKFEIKQEYKDTEGDPQIKSKRRQTAQEIAYQGGPASIKRAKAIITNPTHIAVALEYDEKTELAPKIMTMGQGPIAAMIVKAAQEYNIPIMRNVPLARLLFEKGRISDYVPEESYQAIAEILKWISNMESDTDYNQELFK